MKKSDYYNILGLDKSANVSQIKSAYRKMAHKYHPDKNPDNEEAEEIFKQCSEAYAVLGDPEKKKEYDQFGHTGPRSTQRSGHNRGFGGFEDIFGGFGDMFGDIFGRSKRGHRSQKGADLQGNLQLTFEEAAFGCTQTVTFKRQGVCTTCKGSGEKPGTRSVSCSSCGGAGNIQHQQGSFIIQMTCQACNGHGIFPETPCDDCNGAGAGIEECTINVNIPAGVNADSRIKISGEGEAGPGGHRGDVYIHVAVGTHPRFKREGSNIYSTAKVKFSDAALGTKVEVETLHGNEKIVLPAGTQSGTTLRLAKKGISKLRVPGQGDHFVTIIVEVPDSLNSDQHEALKKISKLGL